jgi:hypothetical protein
VGALRCSGTELATKSVDSSSLIVQVVYVTLRHYSMLTVQLPKTNTN